MALFPLLALDQIFHELQEHFEYLAGACEILCARRAIAEAPDIAALVHRHLQHRMPFAAGEVLDDRGAIWRRWRGKARLGPGVDLSRFEPAFVGDHDGGDV